MDIGIKDKRVLVTGASQGIGKSIALEFAKEECKVSVIARRRDKLEELVNEMGGKEKGHSLYAIDLMEAGAPSKAVNYLVEKNGSYDILVHNIGGTLNIRNVLSLVNDWYSVWRYNVGIAIEINNILIPYMQQQKWGRVIHISSQAAEGLRGCGPYGASKAYLNAYTKVLGKGVSKDGIIVSAIMPGAIRAEGGHWHEDSLENKNKIVFQKKLEDFLKHHQAIGRLGNPEEIAYFAVILASDRANFAVGSIINIDGGTE